MQSLQRLSDEANYNPSRPQAVDTERLRSPEMLDLLLASQPTGRTQMIAEHFSAPRPYPVQRTRCATSLRGEVGYRLTKRLLDVTVTCLLLILLLPVFLIVSLCVLIEDGAPLFYYQTRTGLQGRGFPFYKFRSMVRNADALKKELADRNESDGPVFKMRDDPRVTRTGRVLRKYSLDELPQLINVLRGEMSLIGPRPLPVQEAAECDHRHWLRHSVQPGLLCLREICGRSRLTFDQWMELDLLYVDCHSLKTDLMILLGAIPAVFCSDGAY